MKSKYTKDERLAIGRRIYEGEINKQMAAMEYEINIYTARDYLRLYKASIGVTEPPQKVYKTDRAPAHEAADYEYMSRKELIDELLKLRASESTAGVKARIAKISSI